MLAARPLAMGAQYEMLVEYREGHVGDQRETDSHLRCPGLSVGQRAILGEDAHLQNAFTRLDRLVRNTTGDVALALSAGHPSTRTTTMRS
jgi:hypothetical protein